MLKPNTKDARFIALQKTNQLENTIYLDQPKVSIEISNKFSRKIRLLRIFHNKCTLIFVKVGIVAANLSVSNGDIHHYRLSVSVIPSNIDVWGWEKWYKPESAKIEAKDVRRLIVGPLLKAVPKHLNEIDIKPRIDHGKKK